MSKCGGRTPECLGVMMELEEVSYTLPEAPEKRNGVGYQVTNHQLRNLLSPQHAQEIKLSC